jgi:hypothetical protein
MTTQTTGSKNSTSMTKDIFMLEPAVYTGGSMWNYERPAKLYKYDPKESAFVYYSVYSRLRDAYRAMLRKSNNFRLVYLK